MAVMFCCYCKVFIYTNNIPVNNNYIKLNRGSEAGIRLLVNVGEEEKGWLMFLHHEFEFGGCHPFAVGRHCMDWYNVCVQYVSVWSDLICIQSLF